jgi:hypothetical protein
MPPSQDLGRRSRLPIRLRLAFILLGIFILFWLPVEESSLVLVFLISGTACGLGWLAFLDLQPSADGMKKNLRYPLAGLLTGAAVTAVALALMAVKTGVHGHGISDYSPAQVSLVLRLTLLWMGMGLVAGIMISRRRR